MNFLFKKINTFKILGMLRSSENTCIWKIQMDLLPSSMIWKQDSSISSGKTGILSPDNYIAMSPSIKAGLFFICVPQSTQHRVGPQIPLKQYQMPSQYNTVPEDEVKMYMIVPGFKGFVYITGTCLDSSSNVFFLSFEMESWSLTMLLMHSQSSCLSFPNTSNVL